MSDRSAPVLVVHGAAVRNPDAFAEEVERLRAAVGTERPFIPVFWGDLARPAERIDEVLPYMSWLRDAPLDEIAPDGEELDLADVEAFDVVAAEVDLPPAGRRLRLRTTGDVEGLLDRLGASWRRQSEVARRRLLARVYRAVRDQYLAAAAHFAGDIILYQRNHDAIQARLWEALVRHAPGWGLAETPVSVITHSLGGSVAFDLTVDGHPRLHVDQLLTCACTVPYFHVIGVSPPALAPHRPGETVTLPDTIGAWTNFFVPLDPWGYLAGPVFRLADGSTPLDLEVHGGDREDRVARHGAAHYWRHPRVIAAMAERLG